jgi:hypothetical protein
VEDVVVGKRRGGMKADQRHYPISEYFVNFLDVVREGAIGCPRGGNFEQTENWHGVPTSKLRHDPSYGYRDQSHINEIVNGFSHPLAPGAKRRLFRCGRRIAQAPELAKLIARLWRDRDGPHVEISIRRLWPADRLRLTEVKS